MIRNYDDFVNTVLEAGFSLGGGNGEGIYAAIPWGWNDEPPYDTPVRWHTDDPETDPWEWRIRVLDERSDIAYAKVFFKKSGYIAKDWYPYFLAARRLGRTFEDAYADGNISHFAKRIYDVVLENEVLPVHDIKLLAGFSKDDKSGFDRALTELQMKMFLTMCGRAQKFSMHGKNIAWSSTVFCTTEHFFGNDIFEKANKINADEAYALIREQVLKLNSLAEETKVKKFILGV